MCNDSDASDDAIRRKHIGMWPDWSRKWNSDWDHRHHYSITFDKSSAEAINNLPKQPKGKVLHLIMIRHGQYDLEKKNLTSLGISQSELTGKRMFELATGCVSDHYGKRIVRVTGVFHSDLPRARETAEIISKHLPKDINIQCDPMLAEGWPCIPEPYKEPVRPSKIFAESARIEAVFRKYCHRLTDHKKEVKESKSIGTGTDENSKILVHGSTDDGTVEEDYVILICHQNVIRYFVCRALQLPPEAWLRFRGSNCGVTELIIHDDGRVSLDKFADVGHLPINLHTFH